MTEQDAFKIAKQEGATHVLKVGKSFWAYRPAKILLSIGKGNLPGVSGAGFKFAQRFFAANGQGGFLPNSNTWVHCQKMPEGVVRL